MVANTGIETVGAVLNEMKLYLVPAGIPTHQIRVRAGNHRTDALARAFDWLHELKIGPEYAAYVGIRRLLPEETWDHYKLFQVEGLREQILLEEAAKNLRTRWRKNRPAMFNRDKKRRKSNEDN